MSSRFNLHDGQLAQYKLLDWARMVRICAEALENAVKLDHQSLIENAMQLLYTSCDYAVYLMKDMRDLEEIADKGYEAELRREKGGDAA